MTTPITSRIGSAGGGTRDYSTLAGWTAAIPASLVGADQQWIGECYNDTLFTGSAPFTSLAGFTTDATRNIILRCATGESFKDNANKLSNALFFNTSNGVSFSPTGGSPPTIGVGCDYVTVDGLQIASLAAGGATLQQTANNTHVTFQNILATNSSVSTSSGPIETRGGTAINCIGIATAAGIGFLDNGFNGDFHNCTAVCTLGTGFYGFRGNYSSPLYKNCASFGFGGGNAFRAGTSASSDYNASDQTSPPGAHSVGSLTYANQFQNSANDYRVKAGNGLAVGIRDQTYTNDLDIVGQTRSTSSPTIGSWEYIAAGGPTVRPQPPRVIIKSSISRGLF